jgi:hypothetical protein
LPESIRPGGQDHETGAAIRIWNLMGGEIDWEALPVICEMHGVKDVEILITQLAAIRDHQSKGRD